MLALRHHQGFPYAVSEPQSGFDLGPGSGPFGFAHLKGEVRSLTPAMDCTTVVPTFSFSSRTRSWIFIRVVSR